MFFYFKALHIIFIVTWFSGLFYIVRLFIYHAESQEKDPTLRQAFHEQYLLMEKRLWYGITCPSAILASFFGLGLVHSYLPLTDHPWLIVKLVFVFFLYLYHLSCGKIYHSFKRKEFKYSSGKLRLWNEVATIFLVAIVFLVVLRSLLNMLWGIIGLILFSGILMLAIKLYKKKRSLKEKR